MSKILIAPLAAALLSVTALTAHTAFAKGGQDNFERQQALQAEFEEAREARSEKPAPSVFDFLFGSDERQDAKAKKTKTPNSTE